MPTITQSKSKEDAMDSSNHDMGNLFLQLGLPNRQDEIHAFIEAHKGLAEDLPLAQADFWNPAQAAFLRESIEEDSDWCEIVDELDKLLRIQRA